MDVTTERVKWESNPLMIFMCFRIWNVWQFFVINFLMQLSHQPFHISPHIHGLISAWLQWWRWINPMRPRQNGRHFADNMFKCIFLNENLWIPIEISLKFVPKGSIDNIPALVQIMAWRRPGDKPLSEPRMVSLPTHICVTRPQWVNPLVSIALMACQIMILCYAFCNELRSWFGNIYHNSIQLLRKLWTVWTWPSGVSRKAVKLNHSLTHALLRKLECKHQGYQTQACGHFG